MKASKQAVFKRTKRVLSTPSLRLCPTSIGKPLRSSNPTFRLAARLSRCYMESETYLLPLLHNVLLRAIHPLYFPLLHPISDLLRCLIDPSLASHDDSRISVEGEECTRGGETTGPDDQDRAVACTRGKGEEEGGRTGGGRVGCCYRSC
jgi:hypothetical protein